MSPEEIRRIDTDKVQDFLLRELVAQVAEMNEQLENIWRTSKGAK